MLSDKFLAPAVFLILTSSVALLAHWLERKMRVEAGKVVKWGGLIVGLVTVLLVLFDFSKLPKPQPWVGQVLLPIGIFLWAIVIWRLQIRVSRSAQELKDAVTFSWGLRTKS